MKIFHLVLPLCVVASMLTGCANIQERDRETSEVIELLDYFGHLQALSPEDQSRAHQEALANLERQPDDAQRLRLALILTLPRAPWRDDARALKLIEGIAELPVEKTSPRRDLALVLQKLIGERQRMLREEQRKADDARQKLQAQLAERQRQLLEEQRRTLELQDKVNALRAIDRDTSMKPRRQ